MIVNALKRSQLESIAAHRDSLRKSPHLRWLFFEITDRCNLHCRHCGSSCCAGGESLTVRDIGTTLVSVKAAVSSTDRPMVCLTGGEPMLHPDFFEVAACVQAKGFSWEMTTNATLIDEESAAMLRQTGMSTVSVSLDGMEQSHDSLRSHKGAWRLALRGLEALRSDMSAAETQPIHGTSAVKNHCCASGA